MNTDYSTGSTNIRQCFIRVQSVVDMLHDEKGRRGSASLRQAAGYLPLAGLGGVAGLGTRGSRTGATRSNYVEQEEDARFFRRNTVVRQSLGLPAAEPACPSGWAAGSFACHVLPREVFELVHVGCSVACLRPFGLRGLPRPILWRLQGCFGRRPLFDR